MRTWFPGCAVLKGGGPTPNKNNEPPRLEAPRGVLVCQVYKAVLREPAGEEVAVKVQRPAVLETVSLDLYLIRKLAKPLGSGNIVSEAGFHFPRISSPCFVLLCCSSLLFSTNQATFFVCWGPNFSQVQLSVFCLSCFCVFFLGGGSSICRTRPPK